MTLFLLQKAKEDPDQTYFSHLPESIREYQFLIERTKVEYNA
ncbi:MAG: hypothetical protein WC222_02645 [Parachlamydiales bacterium]|jgi:hypothetical protein